MVSFYLQNKENALSVVDETGKTYCSIAQPSSAIVAGGTFTTRSNDWSMVITKNGAKLTVTKGVWTVWTFNDISELQPSKRLKSKDSHYPGEEIAIMIAFGAFLLMLAMAAIASPGQVKFWIELPFKTVFGVPSSAERQQAVQQMMAKAMQASPSRKQVDYIGSLKAGETLYPGDRLCTDKSCIHYYKIRINQYCGLFYVAGDVIHDPSKELTLRAFSNSENCRLAMQPDTNIVFYDNDSNEPIWSWGLKKGCERIVALKSGIFFECEKKSTLFDNV